MISGEGQVVNSHFTGEWLRASIRVTATDFLITNNLFECLHYQFGPVEIEGGNQTAGEISHNIMRNGAIPGYLKLMVTFSRLNFMGEQGLGTWS